MLKQELLKRKTQEKPIRIGCSGSGWMASGFITQVKYVPGMEVSVLADTDTKAAWNVFIEAGIEKEAIVETDRVNQAMDALRSRKRVVTGDYTLAAKLDIIDIVTDVTPSPVSGADTAFAGINHEKDVILINIEADVTVGRILKKLAEESGVLYSVSSGDEPGCLMELWDFVNTLGYEPIVIGKGKNNPLNHLATPDTVYNAAKRSHKDPFQVASYVDGTKTMFEMACSANATGCKPIKRGMVGPEATIETVSQVFALEEDGGITKSPYTVDFVQGGSMAGGVFITVRIKDKRIQSDLEYLKVGKGMYYTFFRPYHLWFLEAPISFARAYFYRQTTLVPLDEPVTEVMSVAKRDLYPGEILDAFGGYTSYGTLDLATEAKKLKALPIGLAPGAEVIKPISGGQIITWDDVRLDEASTLVKLRRKQDALD